MLNTPKIVLKILRSNHYFLQCRDIHEPLELEPYEGFPEACADIGDLLTVQFRIILEEPLDELGAVVMSLRCVVPPDVEDVKCKLIN